MGRTIRKAKLFTTLTILLNMSQKWLFSFLTSFFEWACWIIACMTKNSSSFNPGSLIFSSFSSSESLDRFAFTVCLYFLLRFLGVLHFLSRGSLWFPPHCLPWHHPQQLHALIQVPYSLMHLHLPL